MVKGAEVWLFRAGRAGSQPKSVRRARITGGRQADSLTCAGIIDSAASAGQGTRVQQRLGLPRRTIISTRYGIPVQ